MSLFQRPNSPAASTAKQAKRAYGLFIGDGGAGGAGEVDDLEAFEAGVLAPAAEIRAGIIEGVAEFDEHVQRHQQAEDVFAARVVDEGFDGDQGASGGQGVVGG